MAGSTVVALAVTVAPALGLYYSAGIGPNRYEGLELVFFYLPLVIACFVFASLERRRPEWWHGVAFGFGVAVPVTTVLLTLFALNDKEGQPQVGGLVDYGLVFLVFGAILGMAGSGVAVTCLVAERRYGWRSRFRPWHIGAAVAVAELATVGALIAKSG